MLLADVQSTEALTYWLLTTGEGMLAKQLQEIIDSGEGVSVEFKESSTQVNRDLYESICAFLNRQGGHLVLGVKDDGVIAGIEPQALPGIKKDLVTTLNNPQKINPPLYALPEQIFVQGKTLLYLAIPESSQVHRCNGRIFDRNEDGDLDITNQSDAVAHLYVRKQSTFSENRIYPYVELADLRSDLFQRVRNMAREGNPRHPWPLSIANSSVPFRPSSLSSKIGSKLKMPIARMVMG